jgi:hypothetical protein
MSWWFRLGRFALALVVAGVVPFAVQCLKGHAMAAAARFAAVCGIVSAAVFTLAGCVRYSAALRACCRARGGDEPAGRARHVFQTGRPAASHGAPR